MARFAHVGPVRAVAFEPGTGLLLTARDRARIWDAATGDSVEPAGTRVAVAALDGRLVRYDLGGAVLDEIVLASWGDPDFEFDAESGGRRAYPTGVCDVAFTERGVRTGFAGRGP